MAIALSVLAVACAAFCVWLTVRIVNRRERWAKWTLAAVVGVPVLYVASFGPACGMWTSEWISEDTFIAAYGPLVGSLHRCPRTVRVSFIHSAAFFGADEIKVFFLMHSKDDL